MTRTTSPAPHLAGQPAGGLLDGARRRDGDARVAARDGLGEPGGRGDGRVRVAARPDVRDRDGVGAGEHVGERVEQGRRAVVGQRLVDRPRAGRARAGGPRPASRGSRSGGGRSRRTRRCPRASPLRSSRRPTPPNDASPAMIASGAEPTAAAAPATPSAFAALWRPAVGRRRGDRAGERVEAQDVDESSRPGPRAVIRPSSAVAGPADGPEPVGDATRERPGRWGSTSAMAVATIRPGQSASRATRSATPSSPDVRDEDRRRARPLRPVDTRHAADPGLGPGEHRRGRAGPLGTLPALCPTR